MTDPKMSPPAQPGDTAPSAVPVFETRDPNAPEFWNERFRKGFTPWEQARIQQAFRAFVARTAKTGVLIPGCGSAHEARWLAEAGWQVRAIDFSADAVAAARAQLGTHAALIEEADFFQYVPPFAPGWIYERAFLCALPPARRADYAGRMAELLAPGTLLAGFFFIVPASADGSQKGPPFAIDRDALDALLSPYFDLIEDDAVTDSIPIFAGHERWLTWRRR